MCVRAIFMLAQSQSRADFLMYAIEELSPILETLNGWGIKGVFFLFCYNCVLNYWCFAPTQSLFSSAWISQLWVFQPHITFVSTLPFLLWNIFGPCCNTSFISVMKNLRSKHSPPFLGCLSVDAIFGGITQNIHSREKIERIIIIIHSFE